MTAPTTTSAPVSSTGAGACPACGEAPCLGPQDCAAYLAQTWAPSPGLHLPAITIRWSES